MATAVMRRGASLGLPTVRLHPATAGAFIILAGAVRLLRPALDPDLGWHLRAGRLVLAGHGPARVDTFSYTFRGAPWVDFEWLWEAGLAGLTSLAGLTAPIAVNALLAAAAFALIYGTLRLRGASPLMSAFGVGFGIANLAWYADLRPGMMGALFSALFVYMLERARSTSNRKWLLLLLPAEVLWANMHGSFVIGPLVCGLYGLAALWERRRARMGYRRVAAGWAALCAALTATTLINPLGVGLLRFTLGAAVLSTNRDFNGEWSAPNFHQPWTIPLLVSLLAAMGLPLLWREARPGLAEGLLMATATCLVLRNGQFVTFYAAAAAPILGSMLQQALRRSPTVDLSLAHGWLFGMGLALLVVIAGRALTPDAYQAAVAARYPVGAVKYIEAHQLNGPMWNEFDWGCFLIGSLPRLPVYIDGRTEMYGDAFFKQYYDVETGAVSPGPVLDGRGINLVLIPQHSALATVLRERSDWHEAYRDELASIFTRSEAGL